MIYDKDKVSVSFMGHTMTSYDIFSEGTPPKKPWYTIVKYKGDNPDETRVEIYIDNSNHASSLIFKNDSEGLRLILDSDPYDDKIKVTLKDNVLSINGGINNV